MKAGVFFARLIRPIVEVRSGERLKTGMMFLYFSLTISLIYILKPVRDALFLQEMGAKNLRYIYMGEGVFLIFVAGAYVQLAKRIRRQFFFPITLCFFVLNLIGFWFLFHLKVPYLSGFFSIWVSCFSVIITTQFWMLANDLFNPGEAKRLFGLIISGGSLGGILGGLLTNRAVKVILTEDLLLVASLVLTICIFLVTRVWKKIPEAGAQKESKESLNESSQKKPALKLFLDTPHLIWLTLLVIFAKMSSTIIDNQFKAMVEIAIAGKEAKTAFFGAFMAWLNGFSFLLQFIFTSLSLRFLGVSFSLWILPVGVLVLSLGTLAYPVLAAGILLKVFDGSVSYSIQQAGKEMLFLPIPSDVRYRVKPVIDMLGFRAAKSLAGFYIAFAAPLFHLADSQLGLLMILMSPAWLFGVWKIRRSYSHLLRTHVAARQAKKEDFDSRAAEVLDFLKSEESFKNIRVFMDHPSSVARKTAALALLFHGRYEKKFQSMLGALRRMIQEENLSTMKFSPPMRELGTEEKEFFKKHWPAAKSVQECPEDVLVKLGEIIREAGDLKVKMKAIRIIEFIPRQQSADLLLQALGSSKNHALRFAMVKALDRLHDRDPRPVMNRFLIKSEIVREAKLHRYLSRLLWFQGRNTKSGAPLDYLSVAIQALLEESLERIFHYLDLLYPKEAIHDIYFQITHSAEGEAEKHHAMELLANTLEPDILIFLQMIFDTHRKKITEKEAAQILKIFLESEDRWFVWMSLFLANEHGLQEKWPDLAKTIEKQSRKVWAA